MRKVALQFSCAGDAQALAVIQQLKQLLATCAGKTELRGRRESTLLHRGGS